MDKIHRLFHDIYVLLDSGDNLVLKNFGLNATQFRTLQILDTTIGKSLTLLGNELLRNRSTAMRIVEQLEARALVKRTADPTDRRAQLVYLTRTGNHLLAQAYAAHLDSLQRRFSVLNPSDSQDLERLMRLLRDGLQNDLEREGVQPIELSS